MLVLLKKILYLGVIIGMYEIAGLEDAILIIVKGPATLNNSLYFQDFVVEMQNKGYKKFIIDMAHCTMMDSTFMGMLTMLASSPKEIVESLKLINLNEKHITLLSNLGLVDILPIVPGKIEVPTVETTQLNEYTYDQKRRLSLILEAHKKIVECSAKHNENNEIFAEFIKELTEELDQSK